VPDKPRLDAAALLVELGLTPKLTVYLGGAPGAGKTHRLLSDARAAADAGRRVAIGWIEMKGRPNLEALAAGLPVIPPRTFALGTGTVEDFDLAAALASDAETIVLDELAHANPPGAAHAKRWQDALALRDAGKSVLGTFNVMHLDTVAPIAETIVGYPIREIVPIAFLKRADRVIALDVSPSVLDSRLRTGRIVRGDDIERAAAGLFQPRNLEILRELLLRTVDDLTIPVMAPARTSTALAIVAELADPTQFLRRIASYADALDLALETTAVDDTVNDATYTAAALAADASRVPAPAGLVRGDVSEAHGTVIAVPSGEFARKILARPIDRDVIVADPARAPLPRSADAGRHPYAHAFGDRMRIGYGKLTVFLGSVAGSGKTYAMLDRAHQLREEGLDVVVALVETHGRAETEAKLPGLEMLARLPNGEMDVATLLARRPNVAIIDELAHTNAAPSAHAKRYDDVLSILRTGIDVFTTLNVQHLAGVGDAVERLTGTRVRETLPDSILELAEEVIFVDVTPDVLRQRLREGKIYPPERVEAALANFFRADNLAALRELAVRELIRARTERRHGRPAARIVLGASPRKREVALVERVGRICERLGVDFRVVVIAKPGEQPAPDAVDAITRATRAAHGAFLLDVAADPAVRLVAITEPGDVLACESPRRKRVLFGPASFALRLLKAGARDLIVLAVRDAPKVVHGE
jgi:two-component system sensor histidine kinase KdpD